MSKANKIKLVEVIADSALGGGPRHVLGLLKNIDKEKYDVLLIAPRGWLTTRAATVKGVQIRLVEFSGKLDLGSLIKLKKNIAQFRTATDPFGPIIIHAHGPRAASFCKMIVRLKERFVYTEHIWSQDYHLKNPINTALQKSALRSVCKRADLVIAVSASVKKFLVEALGVNKDKVKIIPNAIEIDDETLVRSQNSRLIVGTIGALNKQKGHIYLIRAFARVAASLPKARLEIIGDGPESERLLKEIKELGLEAKIQLLGKIEKPKKYLKNWDVFVLPSLSETFGLVILEAFEAKVPVVATNVGGVPELIKNEKTGFLVPPSDSERLAKAVSRLLVEKRERELLVKNAYALLKEKYDWSKIIVEIEKEFVKLSI